jgi:hypothetical protein
MKAALFLLLALGAAFASACRGYDSCQCLHAAGNADDTATKTVCTANDGTLNGGLCFGGNFMDDCNWDDFCALAGGVGYYSNCFKH